MSFLSSIYLFRISESPVNARVAGQSVHGAKYASCTSGPVFQLFQQSHARPLTIVRRNLAS